MSEIEEVKSRLDIAEIVGQFVPLQKGGRSLRVSALSTLRRHPRSSSRLIDRPGTASARVVRVATLSLS